MISIITPAHKILPWHNARLINVCSQSFDDWEWVILDNSMDGCVCEYIDNFFNYGQGQNYKQCKNKIKCIHEDFSNVSFDDGKIGKLKNRCIELTSCKDDEFVFLLDFDDFICDGLLENIDIVSKKYPTCEYITGMSIESLAQNVNTGIFVKHDTYKLWAGYKDPKYLSILNHDEIESFPGYLSFCKRYYDNVFDDYSIVDIDYNLIIKDILFEMNFRSATRLNDNGYSFLATPRHPHIHKKKVFLDKLGGFNTKTVTEDIVNIAITCTMKNMVYIDEPCYIQCMMIDDYGNRMSGTMDVIHYETEETNKNIIKQYFEEKIKVFKNCNNFIKPLFWK